MKGSNICLQTTLDFWLFQNDNGIETVLHSNSSAMHMALSNRSIHKSFDSEKIIYLKTHTFTMNFPKVECLIQCFMTKKIHSHRYFLNTDSLIEFVIVILIV